MPEQPMEFTNKELDFTVQLILINREPWFIADNICKELDESIDNEPYQLLPYGYRDRKSDTVPKIIPELSVYKLCLRTGNDKLAEWIAQEVLPSVRKTGKYVTEVLPMIAELNKLRKQVKDLPKLRDICSEDTEARIINLEQTEDELRKEVSRLLTENAELRNKVQLTYQGRYYSLWTGGLEALDPDARTSKLTTASKEMGYGIKVQKNGTLLWHADVWKHVKRELDPRTDTEIQQKFFSKYTK